MKKVHKIEGNNCRRSAEYRYHKVLFFVIGFILLVFQSGCDPCCTDCGGSGNDDFDVFFTVLPKYLNEPTIFAANWDGSNITEIKKNALLFSSPTSEGDYVFLRDVQGSEDRIILSRVNTTREVTVVENIQAIYGGINFPVLSPAGESVAFLAGNNSLYLAKDPGSSVDEIITFYAADNFLPTYSPGGGMIAFFEKLQNELRLVVVDAVNTSREIINMKIDFSPEELIGELYPAWSSDGSSICIGLTTGNRGQIMIAGTNSSVRIVDVDSLGAITPVISPVDHNKIAFSSRDGDIWVVDIANGERYEILIESRDNESNLFPKWSPDGTKLIFNNFFILDDKQEGATLKIYDFESGRSLVLSNNVHRAFWQSKK